jgi:hypothetical protein
MIHQIVSTVGVMFEYPIVPCVLGASILFPITYFMIDSLKEPERYLGHGEGR